MVPRQSVAYSTIVCSLLLVAACGGGTTESAPPPAAAPPTEHANNINPVPRDRVQDGGKFTFPLDQMPPNFNYNELDGTLRMNAHVVQGLVPILFTNDAVGTPIWNPDYLAAEPTVVTDPTQIITYQINPKAIWYDGTPITWEDFYWQWKSSNGTDKRYLISAASGFEDVEKVERGKDDREVIVTYKHKYADWQNVFQPLYPVSTNRDPKVFNSGWKDRPITTAGPFKLESIDQTAKTITLVRNEKWWGAPAKLDSIVFRIINLDTQIDALANGEVDAVDVGPDVNIYRRAKEIEGLDLRIAGGPNFRHITVNGTSAVLKDLNVRQALAMGIDRATIAKALLGPLGLATQTLGNHIFMANQAGYRDNSGEVGAFNPGKAKELLDAAGWKLEGTVRRRDGRALEVGMLIPTANAVSRQEAELIQNMLGQIGVTVRIDTVPINDFFDKYITTGQFDFVLFSWLGTAYPVSSAKSIYVNPKQGPDGMIIEQNYSRVGSEEIDRLFQQANGELDRVKLQELGNQIDALIWQEVHSIPLYQRPEIWAVKKNLANFGALGFQFPWPYQDMGWMK